MKPGMIKPILSEGRKLFFLRIFVFRYRVAWRNELGCGLKLTVSSLGVN